MPLTRKPSVDKARHAEHAEHAEQVELRAELMQIQRQNSQWDATEFIEAFVREGWESHWSSITITCDITLQELHNIGHLPRSQGTRECRKLVRAPVINDEIGTALWEKLSTMVRGEDPPRGHDDPGAIIAWHQSIARERMMQEISAMRHHNKTSRRRSISPPPQSPRLKDHDDDDDHHGDNNYMLYLPGQPHLSPPPLSITRSPEIQIVSPPLSILRTDEPTTPDSDMVVTGTGARASSRKLSWNLPLPLPERRRSSAATRLSVRSSSTTSTSITPVTPPKSHSTILRNNNTGGMVWEEGFWQQKEKHEVRRAKPNTLFANVDRDTTSPDIVDAEMRALSTAAADVSPPTEDDEQVREEEEEEEDDTENNENNEDNNDNDDSADDADDADDEHVDPFDTTSIKTSKSSKSVISAFTTSTSTSGIKKTFSFPKRILRKLSGPNLVGNIGNFGQSLGAGYGSRDNSLEQTATARDRSVSF